MGGFDLFQQHDYSLVLEPIYWRGRVPWRLLVMAVRDDCLPLLRPWLERLHLAPPD